MTALASVPRNWSTRPAPEECKLDSIHHVAIPVLRIDEEIEWLFRSELYFRTEYKDSTFALLNFANVRVSLVVPSQHPSHIAISRPDAARFGELKRHRDDTQSVYVQDPFGNWWEILAGK
jgi:catechol 2,3-dioxygenase-like lactoylglutathione lyase family enzyme